MARNEGIYRRPDSGFWWMCATLPNGKRIRQSAGTEIKADAEAYLAKLKLDAYREAHFGIKPQRSWQEAVVRYLELKRTLRSFSDVQRICRFLDPYLGSMMLNQINGDVIWSIVQGETKRGNKPATVNRTLSTMRALLRMARDEWQWIDNFPKIRMLSGEVERDRWYPASPTILHDPAAAWAVFRSAADAGIGNAVSLVASVSLLRPKFLIIYVMTAVSLLLRNASIRRCRTIRSSNFI